MFSARVVTKTGLEPAKFTAHQITHQQTKDEPYNQGKRTFWHDFFFVLGCILRP